MDTLGNEPVAKNGAKVAQTFYCEKCDYVCCKKYNWDKHLSTSKHTKETVVYALETDKWLNTFSCENCDKKFKNRSGLWKHKPKCTIVNNKCISDNNSNTIIETTTDKEVIMLLLKQNDDLIKGQTNLIKEHSDLIKEQSNLIKEQTDIKLIMLELVKNGTNNINNSNNTINNNSHNKAFNLNFFLNETCKNAMNITEFVDSIQWELEDLMELGEIGYVASMSKIITKNLNALDETVRPIHCADKKREIFYIKDEDKWEKEDEDLKRLRKIILRLSNKSMKMLPKYREKFPDYDDAKSIHSDEHCKIIIEAVTCDSAKDEKIIRNISKATMISKDGSLSA